MEPADLNATNAIDEAIRGNQMAYSYLLNQYWPLVYGFQLKRTKNEADAEDITIETFAKAFAALSTFRKEYEFGTWLVTISRNIHVDMLRRQKNSILSQATLNSPSERDAERVLDESPSAEDQLIADQNLATLLRHLRELKPKYQQVLQLRYFNELGYPEMAEKLGESIGTVKVKVLRARKLLAERIREGSS